MNEIQKILLISDNHGRMEYVKKAVEREWPFSMMLHLGDCQGTEDEITGLAGCPVYMVRGNCDWKPFNPNVLTLRAGLHKLYLTHGHLQYVSMGTEFLAEEARKDGCDIVLFGHTHCPFIDDRSHPGLLLVNPGSIQLPRQENRRRSYAVMELKQEKADVRICYV